MGVFRICLTVLAVLVVAAGAAFIAASQLDTEERAAAAQNPGFHQAQLPVTHRAESNVPIFLWYPASDPSAAPELIGQNALFYGFHAIRNATPTPGPHPIVLLSHGSGGNAPQLGWLAHDLAMRGFIVLGVNHPGTTSGDSDPHRTPHIWERADDLSAALDWLIATPPLGLVTDETRVASLGFSLGGHTALALAGVEVSKPAFITYCDAYPDGPDCAWMGAAEVDFSAIDATQYEASHRDPRITATVAVDPALPRAMTPESLAGMDLPVLLIALGEDEQIPVAMRIDEIGDAIPGAVRQNLPGAWHFTFLAECSPLGRIVIGLVESENICADPGPLQRPRAHDTLRDMIGRFLQEALAR